MPEGPGPLPIRTHVLLLLAAIAVVGAVTVVVHEHRAPTRAAGRPAPVTRPIPRPSVTPSPADPRAADPCSWLAPADFAPFGVATVPLTASVSPTGLQPGEVDCAGTGPVAFDLRWSVNASTAHVDLTTWVLQLGEANWTVAPATVSGATAAAYLSTVLGPDGRPVPVAVMLAQFGALRVLLALPPTVADPRTALTRLATVVAGRVLDLGVTTAPPSPSGTP